ncbi:MAG: class I SAM-dependent methyltransferase [Sandaracinaceae bacterium]
MSADGLFWDKIAEKYAAKPVDDPSAFDRKIAITRSKLRPDSVALDVGCGTGSLALRLADAAGHVHGLDVSSEMIRIAEGKRDAQASDNVTFHVGPFDASFDAIEGGSLDVVCAYSILHLVPDRRVALAQLYRLLAPGGWLVASTVCLGNSWVPIGPVLTLMRWVGKAPRVHIFSGAELVSNVREAGFVDVDEPDVGAKPIVSFLVARKPS